MMDVSLPINSFSYFPLWPVAEIVLSVLPLASFSVLYRFAGWHVSYPFCFPMVFPVSLLLALLSHLALFHYLVNLLAPEFDI
jgi:hypothetical protein